MRPEGARREQLDFARRARTPAAGDRSLGPLVGLLLLVGLALLARPLWEPRLPEGALVEVRGDVPRPGTYLLDAPTIAAAVQAAGGELSAFPDTPVPAGHRVEVHQGVAAITQPSDPLLVALPVDVNTCEAYALEAIPGVGASTAAAIVADRAERGPFYAPADLTRVRGVGKSALEALTPFVTVGDIGPRPPPVRLDLNRATTAQLERLPGIGPVTAARIVVDRDERGDFSRLEDLERVSGIGPKTVAKIRAYAEIP